MASEYQTLFGPFRLEMPQGRLWSGLAIREFMGELYRRGVDIYGPEARLVEGITALAEVFGASEALRRSVRPR